MFYTKWNALPPIVYTIRIFDKQVILPGVQEMQWMREVISHRLLVNKFAAENQFIFELRAGDIAVCLATVQSRYALFHPCA
jgi:hypothetical protein